MAAVSEAGVVKLSLPPYNDQPHLTYDVDEERSWKTLCGHVYRATRKPKANALSSITALSQSFETLGPFGPRPTSLSAGSAPWMRELVREEASDASETKHDSPEVFAIKKSSWTRIDKRDVLDDPVHEAKVAFHLFSKGGHANLCKPVEVCRDIEDFWFVSEFCSGGDLFGLIESSKDGRLDEATAARCFRQLLDAVEFMHGMGFCHLDLSVENVLLDSTGGLKVCDFGVARSLPRNSAGEVQPFPPEPVDKPGKKVYRAPELMCNEPFDGRACDVYALGVILYIMVVGNYPWERSGDATDKSFSCIYHRGFLARLFVHWGLKGHSPELIDLIQSILCPPQPSQGRNGRLTLEQIRKHPWMTDSKADDTVASSKNKP